MRIVHIPRYAIVGAVLLLAAAGCSKTKTKTHAAKSEDQADVQANDAEAVTTPAAAKQVESTQAAPAANAGTVPYAHTPVSRESLVPPPLAPPPEAVAGPGGVRTQLLVGGTGDSPGPTDTLIVDYSMWTGDGKLAMSSYLEERSVPFSVDTLPGPLRSLLTSLKKGAKARFWVPRAALEGWRPEEWPDSDLVIELVLVDVNHVTFRDMAGNAMEPSSAPPPDAAGPPPNALATRTGLKYVVVSKGAGARAPAAGERLALTLDGYAVDGLVAQPVARGLRSATTLERAPGGLADVLVKLKSGDTARVWFPPKVGGQVIPQARNRELVLDVKVTFGE